MPGLKSPGIFVFFLCVFLCVFLTTSVRHSDGKHKEQIMKCVTTFMAKAEAIESYSIIAPWDCRQLCSWCGEFLRQSGLAIKQWSNKIIISVEDEDMFLNAEGEVWRLSGLNAREIVVQDTSLVLEIIDGNAILATVYNIHGSNISYWNEGCTSIARALGNGLLPIRSMHPIKEIEEAREVPVLYWNEVSNGDSVYLVGTL